MLWLYIDKNRFHVRCRTAFSWSHLTNWYGCRFLTFIQLLQCWRNKNYLICLEAPHQMPLLESEMIESRIKTKQNNQLCQERKSLIFTAFISLSFSLIERDKCHTIDFNCLTDVKKSNENYDLTVATIWIYECGICMDKKISVYISTSRYVAFIKENIIYV